MRPPPHIVRPIVSLFSQHKIVLASLDYQPDLPTSSVARIIRASAGRSYGFGAQRDAGAECLHERLRRRSYRYGASAGHRCGMAVHPSPAPATAPADWAPTLRPPHRFGRDPLSATQLCSAAARRGARCRRSMASGRWRRDASAYGRRKGVYSASWTPWAQQVQPVPRCEQILSRWRRITSPISTPRTAN